MNMTAMVAGYLGCALWSSLDDNDEPLDAKYDSDDISESSKGAALFDCTNFVEAAAVAGVDLDELLGMDAHGIGHDLWLTRNRHGAGFWDRGLGAPGEALTRIAHGMGSLDPVVGDDGKIHFE